MEPSATGFMRCHMRGKRLWPPAPSTNDAFQALNTCGEPRSNDNAAGAAVSGSAPHTRIEGRSAFTALPTLSLPLANGQLTYGVAFAVRLGKGI